MPVFPPDPIVFGAPGSLITSPYQYEFRNFLFGSGTDFITEKVTGLLGMPSSSSDDIDRAHEHGASPGLVRMTKRVIAFDIKIVGSAGLDIEEKLALARKTFQVPRKKDTRNLESFVFQRPGEPLKVLYARCTNRDFASTYDVARGLAAGSVELTAPDPIIYELEAAHVEGNLAPGVLNGSMTVSMDGDYDDGAFPIFTINGPWDNPRVVCEEDDNRTLRIDISLAIDDALRLVTKDRTIQVRRGVAGAWTDAYQYRRADNQWFALLPGVNHIDFQRAATNSAGLGNIQLDWQNAYA